MTAIGALIGLSLSILLIIRKLSPTYSLIIGAIVGGLLGGLSLNETVTVMTEGVKEVTPAVLRILTAGVLSGILIQTGATTVISNAIINKMGEKRVFMALALATMLLCTVGVFIDVAVITVAPVALSIGKRLNLSPSVLLIAMIDLENALLPRFSHFGYNKKIKEILKYVGIDRTVIVLDPKTREDVAKPLYEVATTHTARKTFIGNLYRQVKDPNLIASMSGHSEGSRAFARYRKIDQHSTD